MIYQGGCHCGAICFEVEAPDDVEVLDCNCSICRMTGFLHLIVPRSKFHLRSGGDAITTYVFNTGVARHTFCQICGIKAFYTPRSNPDGIDINVRCLVQTPRTLRIAPFDGAHWEANAPELAHKSREST